jgi:hypothetical protein
MKQYLRSWFSIVALLAVLVGIILRIASFGWNDRLHGDVNLFALTAREFAQSGDFYYPIKYEYSDFTEYRVLRSPASQHPPLWPYVAGLLAKLFSIQDTFSVLKAISEVVGVLLLVGVVCFGVYAKRLEEALVSVSGLALSPLLVDFSANGSLYILLALLMILVTFLIKAFDCKKIDHYALAGLLCGVGLQVHSAMVVLPLCFFALGFSKLVQIKWHGAITFVAVGLLTVTPWMVWNYYHFGRPFYSYSMYHLLRKLGVAHTGVYDGIVTTRITGSVDRQVLGLYISLFFKNAAAFVRQYLLEIGPFCLALAVIGLIQVFKSSKRFFFALVFPSFLYVMIIFLWATYRYRFLVPALPVAYMAASVGFVELYRDTRAKSVFLKAFVIACLAGTIMWGGPSFFQEPPTKYYQYEDMHALQYEEMRTLAFELREMAPGVVLGYSRTLDGGIETVYWHQLPFVYGRGLEMETIQKLTHDFDVRYIWADQTTVHQVESAFSNAVLVLSGDIYFVFEL